MKNKTKKTSLLLILILTISIGYALVAKGVSIEMLSNLFENSWDVHFENALESEDNTVDAITQPTIDDDSITFAVNLYELGDIYSFNIDVVNAGTVDAMVDTIELINNSGNDLSEYLDTSVVYYNGDEIKQYDLLSRDDMETIKVSVKYRDDIERENLLTQQESVSLTLKINYVNANENAVLRGNNFFNIMKSIAKTDKSISFNISAPTSGNMYYQNNGEGAYYMESTKKDKYPIYYYRGNRNMLNNNVIFAGFCWKVVRTTDTGGARMIYNGIPNADGQCTALKYSESRIASDSYNVKSNPIADIGYMYGKSEDISFDTSVSYTYENYIYGSSVEYDEETEMYTLKDTYIGSSNSTERYNKVIEGKRYTCYSTNDSCKTVRYLYIPTSSDFYAYKFSNGMTLEKAKEKLLANEESSKIKKVIDKWYETNLSDYASKLEDSIYCNDREFDNEFIYEDSTYQIQFNHYKELKKDRKPKLTCRKEDAFTVNNEKGNKALNYPIAILTADEYLLGGVSLIDGSTSSSNYLMGTNSEVVYLTTMTPAIFSYSSNTSQAATFSLYANASSYKLSGVYKTSIASFAIRPVVTLKRSIKIKSGDGTTTSPYIVE